ncbi:MAG TPA: alkaline phosphatase PafA [Chitinophagaceae bacterium]
MKKTTPLLILCFLMISAYSQSVNTALLQRPKLIVGIVVDQMRWDYLYRYYDVYGNDGFKRLINDGFSCENTMINCLPSFTAVGHSTIFTGSVPALDGIAGNDWIDQLTGKVVYCTDDSTVQSVGAVNALDGNMSPRNLLVSTITDELRIATNFQSKVVGISLKDRASILPAGHTGNAAFWLDDASGHFITSTYYMSQLPDWATKFNNENHIAQLIDKGWNTLYPINSYKESDEDVKSYEGMFPGETKPAFPHDIKTIYSKSRGSFRQTPFGNTLTLQFAKQVVDGYQLGKGAATDFLTINIASTDYVGHQFGPNSIEIEDTYLRLDKDLADFFQTLDAKVGKGQWLVFLTADHGAAHNVGFMKEHELPADFWFSSHVADTLNKVLGEKFHTPGLVRSLANYQVNFDLNKIAANNLDFTAVKNYTVDVLQQMPGIAYAADMAFIGRYPIPKRLQEMMINGYNYRRSGQVQIVLDPGWFDAYGRTGTTHGTWNPYDTHIPLLWYGWNIKPGKSNREVNMTDISPTLAALLHIQMPNGCVGHVIEEVTK